MASNSFATDLVNILEDEKDYRNQKQANLKDDGDCSLNRFLLSVSAKNFGKKILKTQYLSNIERLENTTAIWIQPEYTRNDVNIILQHLEIGIFIFRVNSYNKAVVLSYKSYDKVQHIRIKVCLRKGFYMDGSPNIFKNVKEMISHYMISAIEPPGVLLKLPRALQEASDINHFKFFDNLKDDFWKTLLPSKSINEIFINTSEGILKELYEHSAPSLLTRKYDINDLCNIQDLVDGTNAEPKKDSRKGIKSYKEINSVVNDQLIESCRINLNQDDSGYCAMSDNNNLRYDITNLQPEKDVYIEFPL